MTRFIKTKSFLYLATAVAFAASSCKKDNSIESGTSDTSTTITVAASESGASTDSLYIIQPCPRGTVRDSIIAAALPATASNYLTTTYSGFKFIKAFSIKNRNGTVVGYVVIVYFNNKPVGILFDANGNFVKILEQREKIDLDGRGWHLGGIFEARGGIKKDTVALASLPSAITSYYTSNYPADTLLKVFTNRDSSYIVISKNNGLYASLFSSKGGFIKRIELPSKQAKYQVKDLTELLATVSSYLETAYPNYTFKKAYSLSLDGAVKAYIVIIDANNTRYALEFDSTGTFVRVKTLF